MEAKNVKTILLIIRYFPRLHLISRKYLLFEKENLNTQSNWSTVYCRTVLIFYNEYFII